MAIDRLRTALARQADSALIGDWDLAPDPGRVRPVLTPAAVLIAVTREAEPQLLLTRRNAAMRRHPGQIAFPGGRIDAGDADAVAAALREAEEEVALQRSDVELLGTLDQYETGTGFAITPVVGVVPPGLAFTPQVSEVDTVFHVPFAFVIDPANHEVRTGEWQGRARRFYAIQYGEHEIWGATAGILVNLSRRLA
ncbi:MAG: CoA pyrophosphatase [Sandarakinorhabdus sp.]|nr:CoA pyrophosphatase [Sandarakinorhabdus sp.]